MRSPTSRHPLGRAQAPARVREEMHDLRARNVAPRWRIAGSGAKDEIVAGRGRRQSRRRRSGPGASFGAAADVENDAVSLGQYGRPAGGVITHASVAVHTGRRARTSGDAQTRVFRTDDKSEL